jgi:hypothetical protein
VSDRLSSTARIVSGAIVFLAGMTAGGEVLLLAVGVRFRLVPALLALVFTAVFLFLARVVLGTAQAVIGANHRAAERRGGGAREESLPAGGQILAVCAYCRKILDDGCCWLPFEAYLLRHSATKCSHGICPECIAKIKS